MYPGGTKNRREDHDVARARGNCGHIDKTLAAAG